MIGALNALAFGNCGCLRERVDVAARGGVLNICRCPVGGTLAQNALNEIGHGRLATSVALVVQDSGRDDVGGEDLVGDMRLREVCNSAK